MWVVRVVCALSLIGVIWMIGSAIALGFTFLVAPIVLAELVLLAAIWVLGRELQRADDLAPQPTPARRRARAGRTGERPAPRAVAEHGMRPSRSLVGRTGA